MKRRIKTSLNDFLDSMIDDINKSKIKMVLSYFKPTTIGDYEDIRIMSYVSKKTKQAYNFEIINEAVSSYNKGKGKIIDENITKLVDILICIMRDEQVK